MSTSGLPSDPREVLDGRPAGYFVVLPGGDGQASADLRTVFRELGRAWHLLLSAMVLGAAVAAGISLLLPNRYRAQTVVSPAQSGGGVSLGGSASGLAAMAGLDLGSQGGRKQENFATLVSPGFARDFIATENIIPALFWDRWDEKAHDWRPGVKVPTLEDAVRRFTDDVRGIADDRKAGVITISMDWRDPALAAAWANRFVALANERLRAQALRESDDSMRFLNDELHKTDVTEMRQAVFSLIKTQINSAMMANVQREFAFHVIDAAVVPERKVSPKRALLTALGGVIGLAFAATWVYLRRVGAGRESR